MLSPSRDVAEPLLQKAWPKSFSRSGKFLAIFFLLMGLTVLLRSIPSSDSEARQPAIDMLWQKQFMKSAMAPQPVKVPQLMQPVKASPFMSFFAPAAVRGNKHVVRATIDSNNFKNGMKIMKDGQPFQIVEFQHVKPGKGSAFVRTKIRNLIQGGTKEVTFRGGEKMDLADVTNTDVQFSYEMGDDVVFMDMKTFEEITVEKGDWFQYLKPGDEVKVVRFDGKAIDVTLPASVPLEVTKTTDGDKGNTASGGGDKEATLETGMVVKVPLFIKVGEVINVDTSTGTYLSRNNK